MSAGTRCSIPYCNGRGGHRFPKNPEIRQLWIKAVKRANWSPTSGSLICRKHFEPTDYITESFYHGTIPTHGTLKKGTVPSLFMPSNLVVMPEKRQPVKKPKPPSEEKYMHVKGFDSEGNPLPCFDSLRDKLGIGKDQPVTSAENRQLANEMGPGSYTMATLNHNANVLNSQRYPNETLVPHTTQDEDFSFLNNHDPTMANEEIMHDLHNEVDENSAEIFEIVQENNNNDDQEQDMEDDEEQQSSGEEDEESNDQQQNAYENEPQSKLPNLGIEKFTMDNEGINYYTGLDTYKRFCYALKTLGTEVYELNTLGSDDEISVKNQFFLTLMKIKQNKDKFELSRMFGVSEDCVSDVITIWINYMAKKWKDYKMQPSKEMMNYFRGISGFKETFTSGRQRGGSKPKKIKNAEKMKIHPGVKILTPDCLLSFISEAYGMSAEQSHNPNSSLTSGGNLPESSGGGGGGPNNVVSHNNCHVNNSENIPTANKTVVQRYKPPKAVEQREKAIALEKSFKILGDSAVTDPKMKEDVVFICFMLVNIRNGRLTGRV